jgi:ABC-2 type transport system permease protein
MNGTLIGSTPPAELHDSGAAQPPGFWRGMLLVAALELRQRLRSRTLWVLAIVWFCIIGVVTGAVWFILSLSSSAYDESFDAYPLFSIIVYFVLLFGTLVAPAISAGSISSERAGGTLATTQVTLLGTWSILLGKACAAWLTGLAFLVVAAPFVVLSVALSRADVWQLLLALVALALQLALFTALGVGLSALISSSLFAIVTAYLLVALLSIGTLIAFALSVGVSTRYVEVEYRTFSQGYWEEYWMCDDGDTACYEAVPVECVVSTVTTSHSPTDRVWWILAMNPYVVVGDMVAMTTRPDDPSADLFGVVSASVRSLQLASEAPDYWSDCPSSPPYLEPPTSDPLDDTQPVWWIGLGLQTVLAVGTLLGGYRKLHTPAAKLAKGSRIA